VEPAEEKVSAKIRLAGAWATLIALYIYADFLSLYRPGQLEEVGRGVMGPFDVTQATLLIASLLVIHPCIDDRPVVAPNDKAQPLAQPGLSGSVHTRQYQQSRRRGMGLLLLVRDCGDRHHRAYLPHGVEMAA
jgi:hypothetical protein